MRQPGTADAPGRRRVGAADATCASDDAPHAFRDDEDLEEAYDDLEFDDSTCVGRCCAWVEKICCLFVSAIVFAFVVALAMAIRVRDRRRARRPL